MKRLFLSVLILSLLWAAAISAIGLQARPEVKTAFFGPCELPCWQGIRPQETTREAVIDILSRHPWIQFDPALVSPVDSVPTFYLWQWSNLYPYPMPIERADIAFTDGVVGMMSGTRREDGVDRVNSLDITTGMRLGDLWAALGAPRSFVSAGEISSGEPLHEMILINLGGTGVSALAYQSCPITLQTLWESPVIIRLPPPQPFTPNEDMKTLYRLLTLRNASIC